MHRPKGGRQEIKTENSFLAKATAPNPMRDPSRQGMVPTLCLLFPCPYALPSGSLHRPSHTVHCLVLQ